MNLAHHLVKTARRRNKTAIVGRKPEETYTYARLGKSIQTVARSLRAAGLRKGDCVGLHLASGADYILFTYAVWLCEACVVPLAPELKPDEKEEILRKIKPEFLLTLPGFFPGPGTFKEEGQTGAVRWIRLRSAVKRPPGFRSLQPAFLRFTSGTTGRFKGVVLSHRTILQRVEAANRALRIASRDRILWLLSMSYHFAVSITAYLHYGATIVLCRNPFPETLVETAADKKCTLIYGSPLHYEMMAHALRKNNLPCLRLAISTTTPLSRQVERAFRERFGLGLSEAYGIIEIGLPCIHTQADPQKAGSVGRLLPDYRLQLKRRHGHGCGEVQIKGQGMFDAYYAPWRRRSAVLRKGWFRTGDLGRIDADGFLYLEGRIKEILDVGGMKFFPQETEAVLNRCPGIRESCVYAEKDNRLGQKIVARIVLKTNRAGQPVRLEKTIKDFCARHLVSFKIPDKIRVVRKLPRTASGKLIRRAKKETKG